MVRRLLHPLSDRPGLIKSSFLSSRPMQLQGGDPTGTGRGGESRWGKPFEDEFHARNACQSSSLYFRARVSRWWICRDADTLVPPRRQTRSARHALHGEQRPQHERQPVLHHLPGTLRPPQWSVSNRSRAGSRALFVLTRCTLEKASTPSLDVLSAAKTSSTRSSGSRSTRRRIGR